MFSLPYGWLVKTRRYATTLVDWVVNLLKFLHVQSNEGVRFSCCVWQHAIQTRAINVAWLSQEKKTLWNHEINFLLHYRHLHRNCRRNWALYLVLGNYRFEWCDEVFILFLACLLAAVRQLACQARHGYRCSSWNLHTFFWSMTMTYCDAYDWNMMFHSAKLSDGCVVFQVTF